MSAFEIASIVGLTFGFILGGLLWSGLGTTSFYAVTAMYVISLVLFIPIRSGRKPSSPTGHGGNLRALLREPRALRLVPAWIAVNAVLGVWFNHLTFQMAKGDDPTQLLVGGYTGPQISSIGGLLGLMFVIGIGIWGFAIGRIRSTTVMVISLIGFAVMCPLLFILNRMPPDATALTLLIPSTLVSLLVLTGFTPAALVYLAAIAEEYHYERGAIMGLYSVFLGFGQFLGGSVGGYFAQWRGVEGMIALSAIFGAVAAVAVAGLIRHETQRATDSAGSLDS